MRSWTQIETWQEFLEEWNSTTTEAGAVGLLYVGAKLKKSGLRTDNETGREDEERCYASKVAFFLETLSAGNPTIENAARRLVVNTLLLEGLGLSVGPSHAQLLDFLGIVHEDLRRQPFPKKVNYFLCRTFYKWQAMEREAAAPEREKRGVTRDFGPQYNEIVPLVKACVAWGALPNILGNQWFTTAMLDGIGAVAEPLLLASLGEEENLQARRLNGSLSWAMNEDPPVDLCGEEGRTELWKRNAITVHFFRSIVWA